MAATLTHNAISVGNTATLIKALNTNRTSMIVQNLGPSVVYIGGTSGVTTSNGMRIDVNASVSDIEFTGTIYGITSSGTADVRYWEEAV